VPKLGFYKNLKPEKKKWNHQVRYPWVLQIVLYVQINTQTQSAKISKKHDTPVNDHEIMNSFLLMVFISACYAFQDQDQGSLLNSKNQILPSNVKASSFQKMCNFSTLHAFFSSLCKETKYFFEFSGFSCHIR